MAKRARFLYAAAVGFCAAVIFCSTLYAVFLVGPAVEGRFFPVVSKLTILSLKPDDSGMSLVEAEFTKLRDCEYVGLSWFVGQPSGGFERVPVILMRKDGDTSSPNRPMGTQRAGPWVIGVAPDQLRTGSFARLSHRCHPFWLTTTDFYP